MRISDWSSDVCSSDLLKHLFVGAEGTLGVITAAVRNLFPKPKDVQTCFVALRDLDAAIELLARARAASGDSVTSFELLSRRAMEFAVRHGQGIANPIAGEYDNCALIELSRTRPDSGMRAGSEALLEQARSEARRVGKECVRTG